MLPTEFYAIILSCLKSFNSHLLCLARIPATFIGLSFESLHWPLMQQLRQQHHSRLQKQSVHSSREIAHLSVLSPNNTVHIQKLSTFYIPRPVVSAQIPEHITESKGRFLILKMSKYLQVKIKFSAMYTKKKMSINVTRLRLHKLLNTFPFLHYLK